MDSYSESEPRKFIFFHLGKENVGQPLQTSCDPESATNPEQVARNDTPKNELTSLGTSPTTEVDQEVMQPQQSPGPSQRNLFLAHCKTFESFFPNKYFFLPIPIIPG